MLTRMKKKCIKVSILKYSSIKILKYVSKITICRNKILCSAKNEEGKRIDVFKIWCM